MEMESVTGNEAAAGYFLRDYLSSLKYNVSLQEAASNRFNVMAFAGDPALVFSTHIDTVLLGPGSILNAHTDHERISKQELLEGVKLYVRLARILLS